MTSKITVRYIFMAQWRVKYRIFVAPKLAFDRNGDAEKNNFKQQQISTIGGSELVNQESPELEKKGSSMISVKRAHLIYT
jgi:hypothetical protein